MSKKRIIRICCRKVIDAASSQAWDKLVFDSSYTEFRIQAQLYDRENKYPQFSELVQQVPAAERIQLPVNAAVSGYMLQLNGLVPGVLNSLGRRFLRFSEYRFEIINSDIHNKNAHQVAVNFFSEPLQWHETTGNRLLLSAVQDDEPGKEVLTDMLELLPFISIYSIREV